MSDDTAKALEVLRATVGTRPPSATIAQGGGARLLSILNSTGWASTNRRLSIGEIINLSAVVAAIDVLSQDIAKPTFGMYERLKNGGKRMLSPEEHPVATLLATQPNEHHTWQEFFEMLMLHLALTQNAFVAKKTDGQGRPLELVLAMPARTTILAVPPEEDKAGNGFFAYEVKRLNTYEKIMFSGMPEVFLAHEFIHFRGRMFDGLMGYSNLDAGAKSFGLASELLDFQTRLYAGDGQLRGVFSHPGQIGDSLSDEAFKHLREQLAEALSAFRRENRPLVLEEGMEFKAIAMTAEQAEVAKARDSAIVDICRHFRMPPHKLMHFINVKYENMETQEKSYVADTLIPYCLRIETRMAAALLTLKERSRYFFEFNRREMMLNDPKVMAEVVKVLADRGMIDFDEGRQMFGYNELGGKVGKVRLIPSNATLIDDKNQVVVAAGGAKDSDEKGTEADDPDKNSKKSLTNESPHIEEIGKLVHFPPMVGER